MMAASDELPAVTLSVGPMEIGSYLQRSGWNMATSNRVAEIWTANGSDTDRDDETELLVPRIAAAPDFERRIKILIEDLQSFEQRPAEQIRDDISRQFVDVTNVAADHNFDSSVFPLDASQKLFFSAKKMVIAAAAATLKRRGYFGHSVPQRARDQARNVLVGHTRPGSYVVPVISRARLPNAPWQGNQPHLVEEVEEAAFDRRMIVTLARGLSVLHELAVNGEGEPSTHDIYDGVGEGLSYELCDGVIRSLKDQSVQDFKVGFKWAPAIPAPVGLRPGVNFPSDSIKTIQRVARGLRQDIEDREQVIYGWVEMLTSKANDTGGKVDVHAMVGGKQRVIRMNLDERDYEKAVASHKRLSVMVRGDLHMEEGKQPTMDVHSFELEQPLPGIQEALSEG